MPTRLYLPGTLADEAGLPFSAPFDPGWEHMANAYRRRAQPAPSGTAMQMQAAPNETGANNRDILLRQYLFGPLAAQTLAGTVKGQIRAKAGWSSNGSTYWDHGRAQMLVKVVAGDGSLRATALAMTSASTPEFDISAHVNARFPQGWSGAGATLTGVDIKRGDFLVLEIGLRRSLTGGQVYSELVFGDSAAGDLAEDEADTDPDNPWVEFSANLATIDEPDYEPETGGVLALAATPYDETIAQSANGPPVPFGVDAYSADQGWAWSGAETAVYLSKAPAYYASQAADDPASTPFPPRLRAAFNYEERLFGGDYPSPDSAPAAGFGDIRISNPDGELDGWLDLGWDGRDVRLYRGASRMTAFSAFQLKFRGTTDGMNASESELSLRLRGRGGVLDRPLSRRAFGGTGGIDGSADVAGRYWPQAYGRVLNVPAVLFDPANLVFAVHDRAISQVDAVRDQGVALAAAGDYGSYAALAAATVANGSYATCKAEGLVRLGASPAGTVTMDLRGDTIAADIAVGGYQETSHRLVYRVLSTRLGPANIAYADLDASFAALDSAQPAPVGYWIGPDENPTGAELAARLMAGIGGWARLTLAGTLTFGRLAVPAATRKIGSEHVAAAGLRRRPAPPWKSVRVAYRRCWAVQARSDLAGSVSDADAAFYGAAARYAEATAGALATKHRQARVATIESFFALESDAEAEAARLVALHGAERAFYDIPMAGAGPFDFQAGDEIALVGVDRLGFGARKDLVAVRVAADEDIGKVDLECWG